ncbi:hypothetical protein AC578_4348 [Pseudocercospora eumusae]|uniref:PD-(D/E)XK nuclease-like domain-containing protein n=1 Tax=Pseudocercospora eumusae TaxID=321146 RepID=A0A139H5S3_9PEZI|nr:hypothetical protein AC578_4348 [Pseudocercospora eumusae]
MANKAAYIFRWLENTENTCSLLPSSTLPPHRDLTTEAAAAAPLPRKRKRQHSPVSMQSDREGYETPIKKKQKQRGEGGDGAQQGDGEDTPRPTLRQLQLQSPSHSAKSQSTGSGSAAESSSASASRTSTSRSSKRKRHTSPLKELAHLRHVAYAVIPQTIDLVGNMPAHLQDLTADMRRVGRGEGIIADNHLRSLVAEESDLVDWSRVSSPARLALGSLPSAEWAQKMVHRTRDNVHVGRSEAAWNCTVHYPILEKACACSTVHDTHVGVENITTATINKDYQWKDELDAAPRKADFAITMPVDHETERALRRRGILALSHSTYQPLTFSPPAISIETKLDGESAIEAEVQLSTWLRAHILFLRTWLQKLGRGSTPCISLPALVVQGSQWSFVYFDPREDGVDKWSRVSIGDSSTLRGVYTIVAALHTLISWAENVHRPWFEQNILQPLLGLPAK